MNRNDLQQLQSITARVINESHESNHPPMMEHDVITTLEDVQALVRDLLHTINTQPEFVNTDKYRVVVDDLCGACRQLRMQKSA